MIRLVFSRERTIVDQYHAVLFTTDESAARKVFEKLDGTQWLRLVRLEKRLYAAYLPFARDPEAALAELGAIAATISKRLPTPVLTVSNYMQARSRGRVECVYRSSVFQNGECSREFGDEEEVWAPLDKDGFPLSDGPYFGRKELARRKKELTKRCKHGFGCIRTAVNAGLDAVALAGQLDQRGLEIAVRYEEKGWIAEKVRTS